MISNPASSWARIARCVASSCASLRSGSATRQSSRARTRGGNLFARPARSISHSGCGQLPTNVVGKSIEYLLEVMLPIKTAGSSVLRQQSTMIRDSHHGPAASARDSNSLTPGFHVVSDRLRLVFRHVVDSRPDVLDLKVSERAASPVGERRGDEA